MTNWQPIETAPKDGTEILIWEGGKDGNGVEASFWCDTWGWVDTVEGYLQYKPTHWMPLPGGPDE